MKICILTPRFSFPESGGDLLRINHVVRYLKSQGHHLILISYLEKGQTPTITEDLYDRVYTIRRSRISSLLQSARFLLSGKPIQCGYYYSRRFQKLFHQVIQKEQPDLYVSHLMRMLPFIENEGKVGQTIVEMTDALSKTYQLSSNARGSWLKRVMYDIEKRIIGPYELSVIKKYPKVVLVSQSDADYLSKQLNPSDRIHLTVHTNGVNLSPRPSKVYDCNKICFIGNMVSLPNQDAAIFFAQNVFPLIHRANPDARFYIVGNNPPSSVRSLADDKRIFVTGFIEDMDGFIADMCVAVAPVNIAAGIQNKVLVAMASKIPVVLSSLIAKPISELKPGENCFVCDTPQSYADSCLHLMNDSQLRNQMAEKGYDMVKQYYVWSAKLKGYELLP